MVARDAEFEAPRRRAREAVLRAMTDRLLIGGSDHMWIGGSDRWPTLREQNISGWTLVDGDDTSTVCLTMGYLVILGRKAQRRADALRRVS